MTCNHETQHPLFGLPLVCTLDEHVEDVGHVYEYKHPRIFTEALAAGMAEFRQQMLSVSEQCARFVASLKEKR